MKERYIEWLDVVLGAYSLEHIRSYTQEVRKRGLWEHGFPRLVANLGILIAHGRKKELTEDFVAMMELCCQQIPVAHAVNGYGVGNDFSVKEVVFCLLELEKAGVFPETVTQRWRDELAKIDPYTTYSCIASTPVRPIGNWAAFAAVSEQLRKFAGIGDESAFIENQVASQLFAFDQNGMYRDPHEPMVYDMVTRLQLVVLLYFGYEGENRARLLEFIERSADLTLRMQSVTGEIPYGGRSNQFLLNEAFYAALCEFYATYFWKKGDKQRAGAFKRAARMALESILPWLQEETIRHVKNYFPRDSFFGCEEYGYFDKYMVTTGSWLYLAYSMAEDAVEELPCPAERENFVWQTSPDFHKVFCKFGDYFVEMDTKADYHYDATGIGRIHRRGVPSALCLSMPFSEHPGYGLAGHRNSSALSLCGGIEELHWMRYTYEESTAFRVVESECAEEYLRVKTESRWKPDLAITEETLICENGVTLTVEGEGTVEVLLPVFAFDGEIMTEIRTEETTVEVRYKGHGCRYTAENPIVWSENEYANRNGHYRMAKIRGKNRVSVKISLE